MVINYRDLLIKYSKFNASKPKKFKMYLKLLDWYEYDMTMQLKKNI